MKKGNNRFIQIAGTALLLIMAVACNNQSSEGSTKTTKDTNFVDTRRNTNDTTNYLTGDTGSRSNEQADPEPPGRQ